ncbi:nucleoside transporter [Xylaria sp. CBS 124048]|nr:nucleoside transporter [Xylaria sp. CBS 124048]
MDRLRSLFQKADAGDQEYQPLYEEGRSLEPEGNDDDLDVPFSWVEYGVFLALGIAMLWAWNMFVAAAPYFQFRFQADDWALQNFPSAIISVYTLTTLGSMTVLAHKQHSASYTFRISSALYLTVVVFALLTISSKTFLHVDSTTYLAFVLMMVAFSAVGCGLMQNGALVLASSFKRPEYLQAIMAGQGIAGVLPSLVQVISILVSSRPGIIQETTSTEADKATAAFIYFLTAVIISIVTLFAFGPLVHRHNKKIEKQAAGRMTASMTSDDEAEDAPRTIVPMTTLFRKLFWVATGVFVCFVVTMLFPVFTPKIMSVTPPENAGALLQPAAFVPLAFFFWNIGDLSGRALALYVSWQHRPVALFVISIVRSVFLPLYFLCNINGHGAVVNSDLFYLLIVQVPFGLSNGWLSSNCMMSAGKWVDESEREASGGFMGLCLVAGLSAGSLLSFFVAGI